MSISATSLSQLFTLADADKNKALSATEVADVAENLPNPSGADAAKMLKTMDTNGDGVLSTAEFTEGVQLNERVANALLGAQELANGSTLLAMLGGAGESGGASSSSLFTSLYGNTSDTSATDSYTAMLEQVLAKYTAATAKTEETSTTETAA